jgi:hypothetical protein
MGSPTGGTVYNMAMESVVRRHRIEATCNVVARLTEEYRISNSAHPKPYKTVIATALRACYIFCVVIQWRMNAPRKSPAVISFHSAINPTPGLPVPVTLLPARVPTCPPHWYRQYEKLPIPFSPLQRSPTTSAATLCRPRHGSSGLSTREPIPRGGSTRLTTCKDTRSRLRRYRTRASL